MKILILPLNDCLPDPFPDPSVVMNVSFAETSYTVVEGIGVVELLLVKTPGGIGPVSVELTTLDGSATGMVSRLACCSHC